MMKPIREREPLVLRLLMWARFLGFLGLTGCAVPPVSPDLDELGAKVKQEELSVLFIGNSYSFGVPSAFKKHAEARGKRVRLGHSTYGGWSLERHTQHHPTLKKLREGKWDVVVLQDFSMHPAMKERQRARAMDPAVGFFVRESREAGAVPLLYQTWGRRDGDTAVPGDDFFAMNRRVGEGYRAAGRNAGGVMIVPVGDAWEREFRAGRGRDLFVEDGSHPSAFGNRVSAEAFYVAVFGKSS
jgi:hypothetical protein